MVDKNLNFTDGKISLKESGNSAKDSFSGESGMSSMGKSYREKDFGMVGGKTLQNLALWEVGGLWRG